jgi:hypothetical protein
MQVIILQLIFSFVSFIKMERDRGIEPLTQVWKTLILPLN